MDFLIQRQAALSPFHGALRDACAFLAHFRHVRSYSPSVACGDCPDFGEAVREAYWLTFSSFGTGIFWLLTPYVPCTIKQPFPRLRRYLSIPGKVGPDIMLDCILRPTFTDSAGETSIIPSVACGATFPIWGRLTARRPKAADSILSPPHRFAELPGVTGIVYLIFPMYDSTAPPSLRDTSPNFGEAMRGACWLSIISFVPGLFWPLAPKMFISYILAPEGRHLPERPGNPDSPESPDTKVYRLPVSSHDRGRKCYN